MVWRPRLRRIESSVVYKLEQIVGHEGDPEIAGRLSELRQAGEVEYITLDSEDMKRHRLRATGDRGTEYAVSVPRHQQLTNGAVLMLSEQGAVVVRAAEQQWLRFAARDAAGALALGYFAGNMHWKVRFDGPVLEVALQGPEADYLTRLGDLLANGRIEKVP